MIFKDNGSCDQKNVINQIFQRLLYFYSRNMKGLSLFEPWFAKKCLYEVSCLLLNHYHINGYFLVRPEFQGDKVFLTLSVVYNEDIRHYRIIQVSRVHFFINSIFTK